MRVLYWYGLFEFKGVLNRIIYCIGEMFCSEYFLMSRIVVSWIGLDGIWCFFGEVTLGFFCSSIFGFRVVLFRGVKSILLV